MANWCEFVTISVVASRFVSLLVFLPVVPIRAIRAIRGSQVICNFPRNLAPDFTHSISDGRAH